jgi:Regulator of chromosome condensation (RCC1) repeat
MRSTRRLLDRYSLGATLLLAACGAAASCSSPDDGNETDSADAGPEATVDGAALSDAGWPDVTMRDVAPPPFDGGPLPVACSSDPCVTSLVTMLGRDDSDRSEGYCALLRDGTVACWGANGGGQLGRGDDAGTSDSPTPRRVVGLSEIEELHHTCAVDKSGAVWCWGTGPYLRDGTGAPTTERTPIKLPLPPVRHVGVGTDVACASNDDGLICWGKNTNGQLAPLSTMPASTLTPPRSITLPDGPPIRDVLVSRASFVLREDGVTLSWGLNPPLARTSSLSADPYPLPIAVAGISSIDLTNESGCATASGIGYCWGDLEVRDFYGYIVKPLLLTLPAPVVAPEPLVQIATTRLWLDKTAGTSTVRRQRWCAVGASGAVYCWGANASGQAGDGTKQHAYSAVKVEGLPTTAAQVKAMTDSTCALLTNGKVYCWGSNYYGQLGNGKARIPTLVPEEVVLP